MTALMRLENGSLSRRNKVCLQYTGCPHSFAKFSKTTNPYWNI